MANARTQNGPPTTFAQFAGRIGTVFCTDGSGNKDSRTADRKRPIYRLDVSSGDIYRQLPSDREAAVDLFVRQAEQDLVPKPILIAADVPIGLPSEPADVLKAVGAKTFLEWLIATERRLQGKAWRDGLVAVGAAARKPGRPFVSIRKGDRKAGVAALRRCDRLTNGESVYCLDHGGKQVGRAALQFWFEVLLPLRRRFGGRLAVWPFEDVSTADVVVAECYPAECQRLVFGQLVSKRNPLCVASALAAPRGGPGP